MGWRPGEEARASGAPGERVGSSGPLSKQPRSSFERDGAWRRVPCKCPICKASRQAVADRAPTSLRRLPQDRRLGQLAEGGKQARGAWESRWWAKTGERGRKLRGPSRVWGVTELGTNGDRAWFRSTVYLVRANPCALRWTWHTRLGDESITI